MTERVYSVVLADDVADLRFLVKLALEGSGRFRIAGEVDNGEDAVTIAAEVKPDLMLLDISMPRKDGLQAIPEILDSSPATVVVILSGFDADRLGPIANEMGAAAYLEKGIPPDQLVAEILSALEPSLASSGVPSEVHSRPQLSPALSGEELLSFVGHELRNPLAVIHGFGVTIQERWATMAEEQKLDLVRRMTANAVYLDSVLTNVMQIRTGKLVEGTVRTRVEDTRPLIKSLAIELDPLSGGRPLVVEVDDGVPPVRVDAYRLRQVLTNLIVNSAKYAPTSAAVTIRAVAETDHVLITVSDEGPGIPADQREAVFDKFMQLDKHGKGLGLGLYISRALMRAMNGDLWVGSGAPGLTMCLRLPKAD
jgi:signal transduction histidine kinase